MTGYAPYHEYGTGPRRKVTYSMKNPTIEIDGEEIPVKNLVIETHEPEIADMGKIGGALRISREFTMAFEKIGKTLNEASASMSALFGPLVRIARKERARERYERRQAKIPPAGKRKNKHGRRGVR